MNIFQAGLYYEDIGKRPNNKHLKHSEIPLKRVYDSGALVINQFAGEQGSMAISSI